MSTPKFQKLDERLHNFSIEHVDSDMRGTTENVRRELFLEGARSALGWAYDVSLIHADSDDEVIEAFLESL